MDQKKYALTWDTYPDHLRGMMKEMMTSEDFADVTLVSDDNKSIKAHKNILSACSPFFRDILKIETENSHPVIYLTWIQYPEMETILQFMYLGEVKFCKRRINKFITVGENLEVKGLSNQDAVNESDPDNLSDLDECLAKEEPVKDITDCDNDNECVDPIDVNEPNSTDDDVSRYLEIKLSNDDIKINEDEQEGQDTKHHILQRSSFKCKHCDKIYTSKAGLWIHRKSKHEGIKYACNQCDYQGNRQDSLTKHIQSAHEGVKYACNQCDKKFTQQCDVTKHIQSVHDGIRYVCDQCDKQYTQQIGLTRHIESVHEGVKYSCSQCDHQATKQGNLARHIQRKHSNSKWIKDEDPLQNHPPGPPVLKCENDVKPALPCLDIKFEGN